MFLCVPVFLHAQTQLSELNKWSVGVQIGGHDALTPTGARTHLYQMHHIGANGRYMFTNRFGLQVGMNYDFLDFINQPYNTYYVRSSLEAVLNLGDMVHLPQVSSRIGVLFHGGFGMSNMWSNNNPNYSNSDPLFKRSDEMLNFTFGLTPQYKVNDRWSVNLDAVMVLHSHQTNRFDMQAKNLNGSLDGYMVNFSVGVTRYFGKNKVHADWTPTVYGEGLERINQRVDSLMQQTKDDDKDGVPNYVDAEPSTPEGSLVNSKGVSMKDSDNDGIADAYDACPDVAGPFSTNGCVDTDKDGVADIYDECPATAGSMANKGCPNIAKEIKAVMVKALKEVQFDYRMNELLPSSFPILDEVVKVLNENPEYRLRIDGYTDNIGEEEQNVVLSQLRAQNAANYLISKGIDTSRIVVNGFGEANPKASNETAEGQALNRRVEFKIIFE